MTSILPSPGERPPDPPGRHRALVVDDEVFGAPKRHARRRTATRLSECQVTALVDGYLAGATVYELAARFGIHRVTVSAHLRHRGITLRRKGLVAESISRRAPL